MINASECSFDVDLEGHFFGRLVFLYQIVVKDSRFGRSSVVVRWSCRNESMDRRRDDASEEGYQIGRLHRGRGSQYLDMLGVRCDVWQMVACQGFAIHVSVCARDLSLQYYR